MSIESQPKSDHQSYGDRLKRAANPKHAEFWVRLGAGTAIATAAVNVLPGENSPIGFGEDARPDRTVQDVATVERTIPGEIATTTEQGPSIAFTVPAEYANNFEAVPLTSETQTAIGDYYGSLARLMDEDATITSISIDIHGSASDEDSSLNAKYGLGATSVDNKALAERRAVLVDTIFNEYDASNQITTDAIDGQESIATAAQISKLQSIADAQGLTLESLVSTYNYAPSELTLSSDAQAFMKELFDNQRSVRIDSTIERTSAPEAGECDIVIQHVTDTNVTERVIPGRDGWRFEIAPFFIPPFPFSLRRRTKNKAQDEPTTDEPNVAVSRKASAPVSQEAAQSTETSQDETTPTPNESGRAGFYRGLSEKSYARAAARRQREYERIFEGGRDRMRVPRKMAKYALPIAGLALIFPWPHWSTEEADPTPDQTNACVDVATDPGSRTEIGVSFPVIDWIDEQFGDNLPPTDVTIDRWVDPNTVSTTKKAHEVYTVDGNGTVINQAHVPDVTTQTDAKPTFSTR